MNTDSSPYHDIVVLFCHGLHGELPTVVGSAASHITHHWAQIQHLAVSGPQISTTLPSGNHIITKTIETSRCDDLHLCATPTCHTHVIRELHRPNQSHRVGLIRCVRFEENEVKSVFREWLETFILLKTNLRPSINVTSLQDTKAHQINEHITALFEVTLRNIASEDEWSTGRDIFRSRVLNYIIRNERIEMSLPAFPCKSPNPHKVGGVDPDMAERIALQTLRRFAQRVKTIYPPGVTIWIVSDGHVFSDCIGIDDESVNTYDQKLRDTYHSMFPSEEDRQAIQFTGLTEMFFSNLDTKRTFDHSWSDHLPIEHPISSKLSEDAELARRIMMAGFQDSRDQFRKLITEQDLPTLNLYRGQARFMQEDIYDPSFLAMSNKQKKKASFIVASEMIARNQAYSNLLEFLLPTHVRLSIHAHSNRGPKFGIRLFPKDRVYPIDSVIDRQSVSPSYEFQAPTPWHNSIIKIKGDDKVYLGKANIAHQAIKCGDFEGGWVENDVEGGHFELSPTLTRCESPTTITASSTWDSIDSIEEAKQGGFKKDAMEVIIVESRLEAKLGSTINLAIRLRSRAYDFSHHPRNFIKTALKKKY
ncbi:Pyoverdine/dityrosine biosynthesis protein-domain-containing protein [Phaeosphaeriaceae sp. PMI808]|nr:Pyoverdine/dityrosine biosynthesis protein-domain-containing protein [Phaeosphaeriaceae sp. PMI808]